MFILIAAAIALKNVASKQDPDGFETNNDGSLHDRMVHSVNVCMNPQMDEVLMRTMSDEKSTMPDRINKYSQPSPNILHFPFPRTRVVSKKIEETKKTMGLQSPRSGKTYRVSCQSPQNYLSTNSCPPNRGTYFIERSESLKKIRFHC